MKIIISHDVDHYEWRDHFRDLFLVKYYVKTLAFALTGKLNFKTAWKRLILPFNSRQHRLPEVSALDRKYGAKSTFFVGMANALGLSYNHRGAGWILSYLKNEGWDTGVHGIDFTTAAGVSKEFEAYRKLTGNAPHGLRMHYLRRDEQTASLLKAAGYRYDSTEYSLRNPERYGDFINFPVSMMDVYFLSEKRNNLEKVKAESLQQIDMARRAGLRYFTVIFHDNYYDDAHPDHKAWYNWLLDHFSKSGDEFASFQTAYTELMHESA